DNEFDLGNKPHVFGQWAAAALLFHRREVLPLPRSIHARVTATTLLNGRGLSAGFAANDALTHRLETQVGAEHDSPRPPTDETERPVYRAPGVTWFARQGMLAINT